MSGKVEFTIDGTALRIEPLSLDGPKQDGGLELQSGRLVIPASETVHDDRWVDEMRRSDQR